MKEEIQTFLTPTKTSVDPAKPTMTQHYALTFNSVDRINKLVGYINYLPRVDTDMLQLVSIIQIAIVQTWALIGDVEYDRREVEQQGFDLCNFTINLGASLLNKNDE